MWENGTNEKYRTMVSKLVDSKKKIVIWAKMDELAKCIYFVLIKYGFIISKID